jgi:hypothetical protein
MRQLLKSLVVGAVAISAQNALAGGLPESGSSRQRRHNISERWQHHQQRNKFGRINRVCIINRFWVFWFWRVIIGAKQRRRVHRH